MQTAFSMQKSSYVKGEIDVEVHAKAVGSIVAGRGGACVWLTISTQDGEKKLPANCAGEFLGRKPLDDSKH